MFGAARMWKPLSKISWLKHRYFEYTRIHYPYLLAVLVLHLLEIRTCTVSANWNFRNDVAQSVVSEYLRNRNSEQSDVDDASQTKQFHRHFSILLRVTSFHSKVKNNLLEQIQYGKILYKIKNTKIIVIHKYNLTTIIVVKCG